MFAPPGSEGTAHDAEAHFEVTATGGGVLGDRKFKFTVCAEHLMPTITWAYGFGRATAVSVLPIYMSWPGSWERDWLGGSRRAPER